MLYEVLRNFIITGDKKANYAYTLVNVLYYGVYAFVFLYLSVYMLDNGFNNTEIGMIMAAGFIVTVFLQQIVANFADKTRRITICEILAAGMLAIIGINLWLLNLHGRNMIIAVIYCIQIIIIMSIQPCLNALNFQLINYQYKMNFGVARSMGSLGYAVVSAIVGQIIPVFGNSLLQFGVIILGTAFIVLLSAIDIRLKIKGRNISFAQNEKQELEKVSYLQFIKSYKPFMIFIFGTALIYYSYATLNNYMYQVMIPLGCSKGDYGNVQGYKAVLELLPMILSLSLVFKFGINKLLVFSSVCFAVRTFMTLFAANLFQIYAATTLQMTSYGIFAPVTIYLVGELFEKKNAVKGQSLLTMAYAIGCVISSFVGGMVLNILGAKALLTISGTAAAVGACIIIFSLKVIDSKIEKKNPMFR